MFNCGQYLRTVIMPEVEEIADGDKNGGAFSHSDIYKCYFPKLKRAGSFAFYKCQIATVGEDNFPVLQTVGDGGFMGCPVKNINLPLLEQVGECGFAKCLATSVSLPSLISVGVDGFAGCRLLTRFAA